MAGKPHSCWYSLLSDLNPFLAFLAIFDRFWLKPRLLLAAGFMRLLAALWAVGLI
jgi:hypothetical protein